MSTWRIKYTDTRPTLDIASASLTAVSNVFMFDGMETSGALWNERTEVGDYLESVTRLSPGPSSPYQLDLYWKSIPILGGLFTQTPERVSASFMYPFDDVWLCLYDDYGIQRYFKASALRMAKKVAS